MSAITPVTAMPANGVSPSGMLTTALPQVRLQGVTASGGSRLTLIQKSENGDWFRVPQERVTSGKAPKESKAVLALSTDEAGEIVISNDFGSTAYHVLEENGGYAGNENGTATVHIAGASAPVTTGDLSSANVTASGALSVGTTSTFTGVATFNAAPVIAAGLTASGSVSNNFSGGTGTFLTSTGLNTIGGDLLMASGKVVGFGAPQALSGAGAVDVVSLATLFTSTGSAQALTLADGTRAGQIKFIMHVVDGGSGVLTPTTKTNFTTVTFTNAYDWAALIWSGTAWRPLAYSGATFA